MTSYGCPNNSGNWRQPYDVKSIQNGSAWEIWIFVPSGPREMFTIDRCPYCEGVHKERLDCRAFCISKSAGKFCYWKFEKALQCFPLNTLFISWQSPSPKSKLWKAFFLAQGQKSIITCHICTRFHAYSHSRMRCWTMEVELLKI